MFHKDLFTVRDLTKHLPPNFSQAAQYFDELPPVLIDFSRIFHQFHLLRARLSYKSIHETGSKYQNV